MRERFLDHGALSANRAPQAVADALAFGYRQVNVLENREPTEQLIDLERARNSAPRAGCLQQPRNILALEQDVTGRGLQHARDEVHERCFAGAVRTNQRMPSAALEHEV